MKCALKHTDLLKTFVFILNTAVPEFSPRAVSDVKGNIFDPHMLVVHRTGHCVKQSFPSESSPLSNPLNHKAHGSQSTEGLWSVKAGLVFFFFNRNFPKKSLSRHYFWIEELDQG